MKRQLRRHYGRSPVTANGKCAIVKLSFQIE